MTLPSRNFRLETTPRSRCWLEWLAADLTLTPRTGQASTFTRTTPGAAVGSDLRHRTVAHSRPRWEAFYNSATGRYEPVVTLDPSHTNLVTRSDNFGTGWALTGTGTRTAAAATAGDITLDLLNDTGGAAVAQWALAVTLSGTASATYRVRFRQGTSTQSAIILRDTTNNADRGKLTITWSGSTPTVTANTGTLFRYSQEADGAWVAEARTTGLTSGAGHAVWVQPASLNNAATGSLYVGGVDVQLSPILGGHARTTGSTVTQNRDTWSIAFPQPLAEFTAMVRLARPHYATASGALGSTPALVSLGAGSDSRWGLWFDASTRNIVAGLTDSGATDTTATRAVPSGDVITVAAQFRSLDTGPRVLLDVNDGAGYSSASTPGAALSAWSGSTLYLGNLAWSLGNALAGGLSIVRIAPGRRTLAELLGVV